MTFRPARLVVVLSAVVAGLLVASPSVAASHDAYVKSSKIVINSLGIGKVSVKCGSTHTCKGKLSFEGSSRVRSFSIPGRTTRYVEVAVNTTDSAFPAGPSPAHTAATLNVHETSPKNVSYSYSLATEKPVAQQHITGTVNAFSGQPMRNLKVEMFRTVRGGSIDLVNSKSLVEGGYFDFTAKLGTNNSSGNPYQLRISGIDKDDKARSWYWRGTSGNPAGGSRYIRKATAVVVTSAAPFVADFNYGSISGTIRDEGFSALSGAQVTVAAPPQPGGETSSTNRELDIQSCADIHARTTTDPSGQYEVDFLPFVAGDQRYVVGATKGQLSTWNGDFGSCLDAVNYGSHSTANLIDLGASGVANESFRLRAGNTVNVDGHFSGFSASSLGDRWVTIRERIPGLAVLEDPVVAAKATDSHGDVSFGNIPAGNYYVELGRRTGCSDWVSSVYPNNNAYFAGLDRGSESWKSFTKLSSLSSSKRALAIAHGATYAQQGKVPKGKKGWMYRDYCKAYGQGTVNTLDIAGFNGVVNKDTSVDTKGAVVHGHVSRTGGRTNKEILVRLSSSDNKRVIRTDLTDSGGNFYIAGLPSGNWTISVNSDSWRGISRTFTGRHSIRVTAGHSYGTGTLGFRNQADKADNGG